jgi:potassium efflux system protein
MQPQLATERPSRAPAAACLRAGVLVAVAVCLSGSVSAREAGGLTPAPAVTPTPTLELVALKDVAQRSVETMTRLRAIEERSAPAEQQERIEKDLPARRAALDALFNETDAALTQAQFLSTLPSLAAPWERQRAELAQWSDALKARSDQLAADLDELARASTVWSGSLAAGKAAGAPRELLDRIVAVQDAIAATAAHVRDEQNRVLVLAQEVTEAVARCDDVLTRIARQRRESVGQVFEADTRPLWNSDAWTFNGRGLHQLRHHVLTSLRSTLETVLRPPARDIFLLYGLAFGILAVLLHRTGRHLAALARGDDRVAAAARVFALPLSAAFVVVMAVALWLHFDALQLLRVVLTAAALLAGARLAIGLIGPSMRPVSYAAVIFVVIVEILPLVIVSPLLERLLLLASALLAIGLLYWGQLSGWTERFAADIGPQRFGRTVIGPLVKLVQLGFVVTALAAIFGYTQLAALIGAGLIRSFFTFWLVLVVVRVFEALAVCALRIGPLPRLGMVSRHRALLESRLFSVARLTGWFVWFRSTLTGVGLWTVVVDGVSAVLNARLTRAAFTISLGDVLLFAAAVAVSVLVSRWLRFLFDEDIYPRLSVAPGVAYALDTMLHYTLITLGLSVGLALLGFDMTRFTVIGGALAVGIGFGMQNIVNNFVSGLILLFERPVSVGDVVEFGGFIGEIRQIGIRSSTLRTWQGADVAVPNSALITESVTNWTRSDQRRRIELPVGVAYGSDPQQVIDLLTGVARNNPDVRVYPEPVTLFLGFGDSSLDFELRAWTDRFDAWMQVKSDLAVGVEAALRGANITIPFPQRDLHLVSTTPLDVQVRPASTDEPDR